MYTHILVPTDGSDLSSAALDQALRLAKTLGAKVTVLTVAEPLHFLPVTPGATVSLRTDYEAHVKEDGIRRVEAAGHLARRRRRCDAAACRSFVQADGGVRPAAGRVRTRADHEHRQDPTCDVPPSAHLAPSSRPGSGRGTLWI